MCQGVASFWNVFPVLKAAALALIRAYQRFISPYKGFSCAYRVHTGGHSCSAFGHRAISRHGLLFGFMLLRRRCARCSWVHHQHKPGRQPFGAAYRSGFVDAGCDGCDISGCEASACEMPSLEGMAAGLGDCGLNVGTELACWVLPECCDDSACCAGEPGWERENRRRRRMEERRERAASQPQNEPEDDEGDDD